jgi:hypothetical protein
LCVFWSKKCLESPKSKAQFPHTFSAKIGIKKGGTEPEMTANENPELQQLINSHPQ